MNMDLEVKEKELHKEIIMYEKNTGGKMHFKYERAKLKLLDELLKVKSPVYWTHNGLLWTNLSKNYFLSTFPSIRHWPFNKNSYFNRWYPGKRGTEESIKKDLEKIGVSNSYITVAEIYNGFPDRKLLEKVFGINPLELLIDQPSRGIDIKECEFLCSLFKLVNKENASLFIENVAHTKNPNDQNQILAVRIGM